MTIEILIILLLLVANGFLALSEIAVVSARRTRLLQRATRGDAGARAAVELMLSPTKFLSTVQVGITLIGILSGAYGGATIARELAERLSRYDWIAPYSEGAAVAIVVAAITYLSVIIGELVPKRIALSNPDRYAALVARPMGRLSRIAAPAVAVLEHTSDLVIRVFRLPKGVDSSVTEGDLSALLAAGTAAGVFDPAERSIVEQVLRLDEPVASLMTPRRDIVWLDVKDPPGAHYDIIRQHDHSRFPVCDGSLERLLGVVDIRDIWIAQRQTPPETPPDLRALIRQPLFVPDRSPALAVLQQFQTTGTHVAIVIDEHGAVDGLLTLNNVLTFLIARSASAPPTHAEDAAILQRTSDSWLVDGALSLGDFYAGIGVDEPDERARAYHTVAGLVITLLGRIPAAGDRVDMGRLALEVVDMDGFRVDKVLVTRRPASSDRSMEARSRRRGIRPGSPCRTART